MGRVASAARGRFCVNVSRFFSQFSQASRFPLRQPSPRVSLSHKPITASLAPTQAPSYEYLPYSRRTQPAGLCQRCRGPVVLFAVVLHGILSISYVRVSVKPL